MCFSSTFDLPARLEAVLRAELPGRRAQRRFAPQLSYGRQYGPPAHDARDAAILLLLFPHEGHWHVPLTRRPDHLGEHAGQISFPGGLTEPGESPELAAARELAEELDVDTGQVTLIGRLSPMYVYASNYLMTPVVGFTPARPAMKPNPDEVAEVLEMPIEQLVERRNYGCHHMDRGAVRFAVPHIAFGHHRIWGATSMILGEFIATLAQIKRNDLI